MRSRFFKVCAAEFQVYSKISLGFMIVLPGVKEVEVSFSIHKRVENEKVNDQ